MSDLGELEARLDAATGRIVAALTAIAEHRGSDAGGDPAEAERLREENETLRAALEKLENERARDIAEIDTLIAQLKPLVEEA